MMNQSQTRQERVIKPGLKLITSGNSYCLWRKDEYRGWVAAMPSEIDGYFEIIRKHAMIPKSQGSQVGQYLYR